MARSAAAAAVTGEPLRHPLSDGAKALKKYVAEHDWTGRGAASELGVSHVTFRAWMSGRLRPGDVLRETIEIKTGGRVTRDSWRLPSERSAIAHAAADKASASR